MSSGSESDFDETPSSGDQNRGLVLAASTNRLRVASPAPPPHADMPPIFGPFQLSGSPTSPKFVFHVCSFFSVKPGTIGSSLHRRHETALAVYLSSTTMNHGENMVNSLHRLLSCGACIRELCTITAKTSDEPTEGMLRNPQTPPKLSSLASASIFESVLFRATTVDRPLFCDSRGGPAELPCVNLGLCFCFMRPLYAAICFSNGQMLSILLRYGAEVRLEDMCCCEEPLRVHPLVRVYRMLMGVYSSPIGPVYRMENISTSLNAVRCHQMAALVMPCADAELREACYALVKTFTPSEEYETLMREKGSLKHFCRMTIRAALARRRAIPKGVEELPLPKLLQRYILYQHGRGCV